MRVIIRKLLVELILQRKRIKELQVVTYEYRTLVVKLVSPFEEAVSDSDAGDALKQKGSGKLIPKLHDTATGRLRATLESNFVGPCTLAL